jgi:hypothetical protein
MRINFTFKRDSDEYARKIRFRFFGNPLAIVFAVLVVTFVVAFFLSVAKYLRDSYFPYQGEVVAITRSWADWLLLEDNDQEHLVIRTPGGDTIDRVVTMQTRSLQRIKVGDYVVKERGIRKKVRRSDKMTVQDIRDMVRSRHMKEKPNKADARNGS